MEKSELSLELFKVFKVWFKRGRKVEVAKQSD